MGDPKDVIDEIQVSGIVAFGSWFLLFGVYAGLYLLICALIF